MKHPYPKGTKVKVTWRNRSIETSIIKSGLHPDGHSYIYTLKHPLSNDIEYHQMFVSLIEPQRKYNLPDWW